MRLVFAGTPAVAVPALDAIAASQHELLAVLTRPDAPAGRGRHLVRSPVGAWADARGVEVLTPVRPREPSFLARLAQLAPDCVPVVAYGALVPPAALAIPRHGWVNLHFSLLPAWRGAAPVQHALLHGDEVTGAAVFELEEGLDTGPRWPAPRVSHPARSGSAGRGYWSAPVPPPWRWARYGRRGRRRCRRRTGHAGSAPNRGSRSRERASGSEPWAQGGP